MTIDLDRLAGVDLYELIHGEMPSYDHHLGLAARGEKLQKTLCNRAMDAEAMLGYIPHRVPLAEMDDELVFGKQMCSTCRNKATKKRSRKQTRQGPTVSPDGGIYEEVKILRRWLQ